MAGEIQLNSTTMATESSGSITAQLDTIRPNTTNGSLTLQGDSSDAGVTGLTIDSSGNATFAQTISGGTLGSSVVFPSGHVIQFKKVTSTTEYLTANNTTSVALSAFDLQITPKQSNSKLLVVLSGVINRGSNSGNVLYEVVSKVNGSNDLSFISGKVNVSAIVEMSNVEQFIRVYEHGQTTSFSQLTLSWTFRRHSNTGTYGEFSFNDDANGANTAVHYIMEIV